MDVWRRFARGAACILLCWCGCGPEALIVDYGCGELDSGALVITEVHANPDGTDGDGEYIELFNAESASVSLSGLTLVAERSDGTGTKSHRLLDGSVGPGTYFVLGNSADETLPDHLDASYGDALGNLRNSEGSVSVWCGDELVDRVTYARTADGRALELDGALHPDHRINDEARNWCFAPEGTEQAADGNLGTPGRANHPCDPLPLEGTCVDGESSRVARTPAENEVHISEWMANPFGPDGEHEWVEIRFDAATDLHGFELGPTADELRPVARGSECFPLDAGARVVFGASPAAAPRVDAELGFSLGNSGERSVVAGVGGVVLDRVSYDSTVEGVSWQVTADGEQCLAERAPSYGDGGLGTPGEPNFDCPVELPPETCLDGGEPRRIASPEVGEARIVEWMADPEASSNRAGEWVEVKLDAAVDLNGLALEDEAGGTTRIASETCLPAAPGTRLLFVKDLDPEENGGIEAGDFELSLSLNNRNESISLTAGEKLLETVSYGSTRSGTAMQVDPAGNLCPATTPYGDGDLGTPGAPNPPCP